MKSIANIKANQSSLKSSFDSEEEFIHKVPIDDLMITNKHTKYLIFNPTKPIE